MMWKEQFENTTCSLFVKATGDKGEKKNTTHYYCNRSGKYREKCDNTRKRRTKLQGTAKIDAHCTASIVTYKSSCGTVNVHVCKTHYGHEHRLGHLRIPTGQRQALAGQIVQGVTFEHVLDQIRDSVCQRFERVHLLTRKDLSNIERAFGLRGSEKHKDDATSVRLWVQEMQDRCENNPVLLYKPQGEPDTTNLLQSKDFVLALQTPLQA